MTKVLSGDRFSSWYVMSVSGAYANCRCDCGVERRVRVDALRDKRSKSCGGRHGQKGTPTHTSWKSMLARTRRAPGYADIDVCDEWHDFRNFLRDMGSRPSQDHSLDRIDNSRGYSPSNCRWATPAQQAQNQRRTKLNHVSVCIIRHLAGRGVTQDDIAAAFETTQAHVSNIVRRKRWANTVAQIAAGEALA